MKHNRKHLRYRSVGSRPLRRLMDNIQQRLELVRQQRADQRKFEHAQLHFRDAKNLNQWWDCVCKAAKVFDFARISLELASHQDNSKNLTWQKDQDTDNTLENLLEMRIPIRHQDAGPSLQMEIHINPNGSLENTGHRITLFTRLADEFQPSCLNDSNQRIINPEPAQDHPTQIPISGSVLKLNT